MFQTHFILVSLVIVSFHLTECFQRPPPEKEDPYKYRAKGHILTSKDLKKIQEDDISFWSGVRDCQDVYDSGHHESGVYAITPRFKTGSLLVYCEMDTIHGHGWLVIQRRTDGSTDFNAPWLDYMGGFGDILSNLWLGNENLYAITNANRRQYELLVDLSEWEEDGGEDLEARYSSFRISHERYRYKLRLGKFLGGAANDSLSFHSGGYFSTKDADYDDSDKHCAERYQGGWWFRSCIESNLNGVYHDDSNAESGRGVYWYWRKSRYNYSFKYSAMKLRPVKKSRKSQKKRKDKKVSE
ncbi:ryncolin-4-like [Glandiceps talaboti]